MTPTTTTDASTGGNIVDVDVADEMRDSFLEYAYSVIYSRALPDARDGLKPVQRRILFQMAQMSLWSDRGHVKSARVVGEVMGRLHPHGDGAIYDALVRLAAPYAMRLPLVDGHGNFGSLDDGPAAMRYTECRLDAASTLLTTGLEEDTVDFGPNYDGRETEPLVLPSAVPLLLVNGAAGIAVGMATNMAPHNLVEACAAAKLILRKPRATLDDVMAVMPGPDLPGGGVVIGGENLRRAYETGRGSFRMRATARIEQVTPKRKGIVISTLPHGVGPERVIEKIKELVVAKKIEGIADLTDLTDGDNGMQLVVEIKNGFSPDALLTKLYRLTPLEEAFNINNVALVNGQPRTMGVLDLLKVFIEHRREIVRRRTEYRRARAADRLHLVEGLLIAILDIDEVIQVIRSSEDASVARERLIQVFDLSDTQTTYILDMPLRRLTKLARIELEREKAELEETISQLSTILDDPKVLQKVIADELDAAAKDYGNARRTVLLDEANDPVAALPSEDSIEVPDAACQVILTTNGMLARTATDTEGQVAASKFALRAVVPSRTRGTVAVITTKGRALLVPVIELPMTTSSGRSVAGASVSEYCSLERREKAIGLLPISDGAESEPTPLALGTAQGVVKRLSNDVPSGKQEWQVINLKPGDSVVGAGLATDEDELCLVTSDAQLLRFGADKVRPQGRGAGGMAGIKLAAGAKVVGFNVVPTTSTDPIVVTIAGSTAALEGTGATSIKTTEWDQFPAKGRATGGVRCHRLAKNEDSLLYAWAGTAPVIAATGKARPVDVPTDRKARDASGDTLTTQPVALGGSEIGLSVESSAK